MQASPTHPLLFLGRRPGEFGRRPKRALALSWPTTFFFLFYSCFAAGDTSPFGRWGGRFASQTSAQRSFLLFYRPTAGGLQGNKLPWGGRIASQSSGVGAVGGFATSFFLFCEPAKPANGELCGRITNERSEWVFGTQEGVALSWGRPLYMTQWWSL